MYEDVIKSDKLKYVWYKIYSLSHVANPSASIPVCAPCWFGDCSNHFSLQKKLSLHKALVSFEHR